MDFPTYYITSVQEIIPSVLVHTAWEKFEKAAFFLRVALPLTLTCQENRAYSKRSSKRMNLETAALRFSVDGNIIFENAGASRRRWRHDNPAIFMPGFSSNTDPQWQVMVAFLNFSDESGRGFSVSLWTPRYQISAGVKRFGFRC